MSGVHSRVAAWFLRPARRITVTILFLMACGASLLAFQKIGSDEAASCHIQAVGLPASRELRGVMADSAALFSFPPTPSQKRDQASLPPDRLRAELAVVTDLHKHLANYTRLVGEQPLTRAC